MCVNPEREPQVGYAFTASRNIDQHPSNQTAIRHMAHLPQSLNMDNVTNPLLANAGTQQRCEQCRSILLDGRCLACPPAARVEVGQASRGACQMGSALAKGGANISGFVCFLLGKGRGAHAIALPI